MSYVRPYSVIWRRNARMRKLNILCATLFLLSSPSHAEYFLDWSQKGELIARGEITGRDQALYNVWIVPGYEAPLRRGGEGWRDAGSALGEYIEADVYDDMGEIASKSWRFARKDILWEFALEGTADSWQESFADAQERTQKRVFGWWFAYPWALIEGTGSTLLRVGLGVPGSLIVAAGGTTLVPAGRWLFPAGKSLYYVTVPGVLLPALSITWDGIAAPPLALFGQQPTLERADGFWLKRVEPGSADTQLYAAQEAFERWQDHLQAQPEITEHRTALAAFRQRQEEARTAFLAQQAKAASEYETQMGQTHFAALQAVVEREGLLPPGVNQAQLQQLVQRYGQEPFLDVLQKALTLEEARWYLGVLLQGVPAPDTVTPALRGDDERTDPVRRNIELLGR